jgi:hypothetical protein
MATNDTLVQMIETLVQEKTFSLDALEAIKVLRDKAVKLQEELDATKRMLESINAAREVLSTEKTHLLMQLDTWIKRESDLLARERNMFALEQRTAVAEAKADAFLMSMKITFAPNLVRNSLQDLSTRSDNRTRTDYSHNINESSSQGTTENTSRTNTTVDGYSRPGDQDENGGAGVQPKNTL